MRKIREVLLVVLDLRYLPPRRHSTAWQRRLTQQAREHTTGILLLTHTRNDGPSTGPLVHTHVSAARLRRPNGYAVAGRVLKRKGGGALDGFEESRRGPVMSVADFFHDVPTCPERIRATFEMIRTHTPLDLKERPRRDVDGDRFRDFVLCVWDYSRLRCCGDGREVTSAEQLVRALHSLLVASKADPRVAEFVARALPEHS